MSCVYAPDRGSSCRSCAVDTTVYHRAFTPFMEHVHYPTTRNHCDICPLQLAIAVPADHCQKIGHGFIYPGFRKPLGDFNLFGEEPFGLPPFRLIALGSLQFYQHPCPTEDFSFRCAPMPSCNLCMPCVDKDVGQPVAFQVEFRSSDIALDFERLKVTD